MLIYKQQKRKVQTRQKRGASLVVVELAPSKNREQIANNSALTKGELPTTGLMVVMVAVAAKGYHCTQIRFNFRVY